jgi:tetratricopeptide (TPR) repeat protein
MKIAFAFVLLIGLIVAGPCASAPAYGFSAETGQLNADQMLSIAEKHFEIAKLLIKESRFDRVLPEMRKILDLNLQGEYEQSVAESSSLIARLLSEARQTALAHELLDETLARMKQCANVASLLKIKAYLYKSEGKVQKAIETFERAVDVERQCAQQ